MVQLSTLQAWARSSFDRLHGLFETRKAEGFIRECHGDIPLIDSATLIDGKVVIFDCIEFNEPFRLTVVYADAGVPGHGPGRPRPQVAGAALHQPVPSPAITPALELLNFYKAYRALVRAKVALFSMPTSRRWRTTSPPPCVSTATTPTWPTTAPSRRACWHHPRCVGRWQPCRHAHGRSRWVPFACARTLNASACSASRPNAGRRSAATRHLRR